MRASFVDARRRYRLDSRLATGGMGEVWSATDTVLDRPVAIKVLKPEYADDSTFRSRLEVEARSAGSLHHPGVAAVYDFGEGPSVDGGSPRPFLVMELVDGRPLSDLLRPGEPVYSEDARDLVIQAADALGAAHAAGIVHRDVKPGNLLVTPSGRVKVTDFGIARAAQGMALTMTGQVVGTPAYISPEQANGSSATAASDVYALGVLLYELLVGVRPFGGDNPVTIAMAHVREPVPPLPPSVPEDLARVVHQALAKDPAHRFATGSELAAALRAPLGIPSPVPMVREPTDADLAHTQVIAGDPAALAPTPEYDEPPRRRPGWLWAVVALVLLILMALVLLIGLTSGSPDTPADSGPSPSRSASSPSSSTTPRGGIRIVESDYLGRDAKEVKEELEKKYDLHVYLKKVDNPGDKPKDTVSGISPQGTFQRGDFITVSFWGDPRKDAESTSPTESPTQQPTKGKGKGHHR